MHRKQKQPSMCPKFDRRNGPLNPDPRLPADWYSLQSQSITPISPPRQKFKHSESIRPSWHPRKLPDAAASSSHRPIRSWLSMPPTDVRGCSTAQRCIWNTDVAVLRRWPVDCTNRRHLEKCAVLPFLAWFQPMIRRKNGPSFVFQ